MTLELFQTHCLAPYMHRSESSICQPELHLVSDYYDRQLSKDKLRTTQDRSGSFYSHQYRLTFHTLPRHDGENK